MKRRDFITLLGGAIVTLPSAARAQQPTMPVIGFLNSRAPGENPAILAAFLRGLKEAGYAEGQNVTVEYRWADGQYDRLPALAADLVGPSSGRNRREWACRTDSKGSNRDDSDRLRGGIRSARVWTCRQPEPPRRQSYGCERLGRPDRGEAAGVVARVGAAATIIALLVNPTTPAAETIARDAQAAARALGLQLHVLHASSDRDFELVFKTVAQLRAGALVIGADPFFTSRSQQLAKLTVDHAVPAIYEFREFAAAGGLISYGTSIVDAYRLAGVYTGRILKSEKPSDLPVQQATKVELFINLKTAKALGINVPTPLVGRADEVIE